ncbi:MAG: DegQ family serine endoprotease [Thermoguttaceae bacterium]
MSYRRKPIVASLALLIALAMLTVLVWMVPGMVQRLAYAAESVEAQAAKDQLAKAADLSQAFQYVAKTLRPSVVSISSVRHIQAANPRRNRQVPEGLSPYLDDDTLEQFFGLRIPEGNFEQRGMGTGVIVSKEGYILTNNHVVAGADEVNVTLSDGRSLRAEVVGADDKSDVAVLKIESANLVPAPLGDSDAMQVGEWVLAIGSPFGLDQTVTAGIVSAKGRADMGITDYEDFIQTDAAINPGNSGGPLVNLRGEVVGINTAIASRSGGSMGVGFSIPSNMVRMVMNSILEHGSVERGFLGAGIQDLTEDLAASFGYKGTAGVLIGDVVQGGPAAKAGLQPGDIVVELNGVAMQKAHQLRNAVAGTKPGTRVPLTVVRNGKSLRIDVELGRLETQTAGVQEPGMKSQAPQEESADLGMTVQTLTPDVARQLGADEQDRGVVITAIEPGSLAARLGLQPGDVILAIGNAPVHDVAAFHQATQGLDVAQGFRIQVMRGGSRQYLFFRGQ